MTLGLLIVSMLMGLKKHILEYRYLFSVFFVRWFGKFDS